MPDLSRRTLLDLRWLIDGGALAGHLTSHRVGQIVAEFDRALSVPRGVRLARKRVRSKRETRKEKVSGIRAQVFARAGSVCECCGNATSPALLEMDHFFSGSGRRRALESVETCWAICGRRCHREKTNNRDPTHYLVMFVNHCERHGYLDAAGLARDRLGSLEIQAQLAQPKGAV